MLIPSGEGEGMVNSQLVTQGNFNSPSRGLAVVVKKRIPTTRGSASRGRNLFFTTPAKPWLGELKLPFVTRWEFIIPTTRGFATCGRNYTIPSPPPEGITSMFLFNFLKVSYNREGEVLNQRAHILSFFNKGRHMGDGLKLMRHLDSSANKWFLSQITTRYS